IPEDWQKDFHQTLLVEIEGMYEEEAVAFLQEQHNIWLLQEAPMETQFLEHLLSNTSTEWNLNKYQQICGEASALSQRKPIAVKRIREKYGIELDIEQPLIKQIEHFFIEQLQPEQQEQFFDTKKTLGKMTTNAEKIKFLEEHFSIEIKRALPIPDQLEKNRIHSYLENEVIDSSSDQLKRTAWIYLLKKLNILA
ncbi:MAG: hypothetical protein ACE5GN_05975, partial [Waddliaceae bacterium]